MNTEYSETNDAEGVDNPDVVANDTEKTGDRLSILHRDPRKGPIVFTKRWGADEQVHPVPHITHHRLTHERVTDLASLADLLRRLSKQPDRYVIRGRFVGQDAARQNETRKLEFWERSGGPDELLVRRSGEYFEDQGLHSVCLDVDGFSPLVVEDVTADPEGAVREFRNTLPAPWRECGCVWKLSSSAGHPSKPKDELRAHLWFWLDRPVTTAQLAAYGAQHLPGVDQSVFRVTQPIYSAAPIMDPGVVDPVKVRMGLIEGPPVNADEILSAQPMMTKALSAKLANVDPLAAWFREAGRVLSEDGRGRLNIRCPFEEEHSTTTGDSSTTYMLPFFEGRREGFISCLHAGCDGRAMKDFMARIAEDGGPGDAGLDFEVIPPTPKAPAQWRNAISYNDLMKAEFKPLRWAVEGLLPEGLVLFAARPKLGKSWAALDLALAVATGGKVFGRFKATQGDVLYMGLEDSPRRLQSRLKLMGAADVGTASFVTEWPKLNSENGKEEIERWIDEHPNAKLVVIDTLQDIRDKTNGRRNSYEIDVEMLRPLQRVTQDRRITVLLVHHHRKGRPGEGDLISNANGTTGIPGKCDAVWSMTRVPHQNIAKFELTGRDTPEMELLLEWRPECGRWFATDEAPAGYDLSPEAKRVLEEFRQHPDGAGSTDIARKIGKTAQNVNASFNILKGRGLIKKEGRKWKLV